MTKQLGINLEWAKDWSKVETFNNLALQCRAPGDVGSAWVNSGKKNKDENGNMLEDFGIMLYAGRNPEPQHTKYYVYFKCNGETPRMTSDFYPNTYDSEYKSSRLLSLEKDQTTNIWKATFFVRAGVTQVIMSFIDLGGFLSDLKVFREGADQTQLLNKDFLEMIKGYNCYRFMELTGCNNSEEVEWKDRTSPNEIGQPHGIAWEYVAEIANVTKADIWINIPHKATDDYIRKLAILMKEKLKGNQNMYIEYSNELWNGMFKQSAYINQVVSELNNAGNKKYSYSGDMYIWAQRYNADRCRDISNIFAEVWGKQEINKRVRVVIGGWGAVLNHSRTHMDFLTKEYPDEPVSSYIYGIASGSYYGETNQLMKNSVSEEEMFESINNDILNFENRYHYKAFKELADKHNIRYLIYEGGIDIQQSNYVAKAPADVKDIRRLHFQNNPELESCVNRILDNYTGELFMWYKASVNDMWGFTTDIERTDAPIQSALRKYINRTLINKDFIRLPTFDKKFVCKKSGIMGRGFNGIYRSKNRKRGK